MVDFEDALRELGFEPTRDRAAVRGGRIWSARPNRFLTYFVHAYPDGSALLTFEFAIADYLATLGLQVGSSEELNQFLYPRHDVRGPQDSAWLAAAIDHAESLLRSVHLADAAEPPGEAPPESTR